MSHPSSGGKKGGGKSGRKNRQKKKGTWVCKDCQLEYCEHRPIVSRGAKPKEKYARRVRKSASLSDYTLACIAEVGLSTADFIAIAAVAYKERRPMETVLKEWIDAHA
jgi:hypothetical protein